ncbi:alanine racemase [Buchananella felis]|uniref:alanine racemase n=1 Tax=Buchananella felis TaxID=3231492 RepID=UPI0035275D82
MTVAPAFPGRALISLPALRHNLALLAGLTPGAQPVAVVKADAYGHGGAIVAAAMLRAGVKHLAVAQLSEALELLQRLEETGCPLPADGSMLAWIYAPGTDLSAAVRAGVDLTVSAPWQWRTVAAAARATGLPARVHIQVDTGMTRAGFRPEQLDDALTEARSLAGEGLVGVRGVWTHLARADSPQPGAVAATRAQLESFTACAERVRAHFPAAVRHALATSGAIYYPHYAFERVRLGISLYGLAPNAHWEEEYAGLDDAAAPAGALAEAARRWRQVSAQLRPAMSLRAPLLQVSRVPAGTPVSYGGTWRAPTERWLGTVPLGYADGVPRHASNAVSVWAAGALRQQVGRVCMDQFVIDLGPVLGEEPPAVPGDEVVLFGAAPAPSADDWAAACGTIGYEIVTRVGVRVPRVEEEE